jgi:hypothetical protein
MKTVRKLAISIIIWISSSAYAGSSGLLDAAHIKELMKKDQPCCVIDVRDEGLRKQQPIPFSATYTSTLKPTVGGYALVVGNNDKRALAIAKKIAAKKNTGDVYAVAGGYNAWRLTQGGDVSSTAVAPDVFTIPKNTCEQGEAVQKYKNK